MECAYAASGEEVLNFFHVDEQRGLSEKEVTDAQQKYGKNCKQLSRGRKGGGCADTGAALQPYRKNLRRRCGSSSSNSLKISSS